MSFCFFPSLGLVCTRLLPSPWLNSSNSNCNGLLKWQDLYSRSEAHPYSYKITTYGISSFNEWHASSIRPNPHGGSDYILCHKGYPLANISLKMPGIHNVLNSLAVIVTMMALFTNQKQISELINCARLHLSSFIGVSRRFEMVGTVRGCHIYDDYAHHPTEVHAVLQAARQRFPKEALVVVFQPHTYSRLAALKNDFARALSKADDVMISAVYPAREVNTWNINGRDLAASIVGTKAEYIPNLEDVVDMLVLKILEAPDHDTVVLTLGAGDISTVGTRLLHELRQRLQNVL
ncbi:Mur ligase, C-terminal [Dillenia turbinata]|uniref:Mur ligase, C-terminal n=1 Tax=Dillenia turbinata TaxID=194707 RepID=A0AAN8VMC9_9MAGN